MDGSLNSMRAPNPLKRNFNVNALDAVRLYLATVVEQRNSRIVG